MSSPTPQDLLAAIQALSGQVAQLRREVDAVQAAQQRLAELPAAVAGVRQAVEIAIAAALNAQTKA